jgi:hypothetical protein
VDGLRIADGFTVPVDLVVQQSAILARTGAGKTNAATVICEELLAAGQQVVIIDPPGAWWGLTASADGGPGGFPIVVLGGEHGNLPLPPSGGALLADVVVDQGVSAILDLSDLSNAQISAFVLAFAARLYERKARARSPMLLVIEEADEVAPQRAMPDQTRMLGAIERVVKRGRMRGIGTLMISQRSASLNKNVLSQAELLIAMQTTAPQDIKAIDAWIEHHGDQEKRQRLISEIATLGKGEAFVWSPGWLHEFRKIRFRLRRTFDSSATPKPGETWFEPTSRAAVDLEAIRTQLEAPIEQVEPKAVTKNDRRAMAEQARLISEQQQTIADLERQLRERPPLDLTLVERFSQEVAAAESAAMRMIDAAGELRAEIARVRPAQILSAPDRNLNRGPEFSEASKPPRSVKLTTPSYVTPTDLSNPQIRILEALASFRALGIESVARSNVAVFADASPRSSGFANNLGALRTRGLLDYPGAGAVAITDDGLVCVDEPTPIRSLDQLHEAWFAKLPRPQVAILRALIWAFPAPLDRERLASEARQSPTSSGYANNLGALRSLNLVSYPARGFVSATDLLFPAGLR